MKITLNGLELRVDYTPPKKGTRDRYRQVIEPDVYAEVDVEDVRIADMEAFIDFLYENCYYEMLKKAKEVADSYKAPEVPGDKR